ncbi:unnamed protein product [Effrenium voratum]|nr:unnamed protein product [Effrenium voratum]
MNLPEQWSQTKTLRDVLASGVDTAPLASTPRPLGLMDLLHSLCEFGGDESNYERSKASEDWQPLLGRPGPWQLLQEAHPILWDSACLNAKTVKLTDSRRASN